MRIQKEYLAPCGLYCGVCSILIAHRDNNQRLKEKLSGVYGVKPEDLHCTGCLSADSSDIFPYCLVCAIKSCAAEKNIEGCHQCDDFPCTHVENFPNGPGKKVILKSVPLRRSLGSAAWALHEEQRYACPDCSNRLFRGARRCNKCGKEVELD